MQKHRKRILTLVLTMLVVIGCIAGCSNSKPQDDKVSDNGDTVTIKLNTPKNGSVSFSNSDDMSMKVKTGDTVELKVVPDKGYNVSSSFLKTEKGATHLEVNESEINEVKGSNAEMMAEGKIAFKAEESGDVSVAFNKFVDYTSKRLVVMTDDPSVISADDDVIAKHGNMYVLDFDSEESAEDAYNKYKDNVTAIEPDASVTIAAEEDTNIVTDSNMVNSFEVLNNMKASKAVNSDGVIALIDTGVDKQDHVIDRVSVIDNKLSGNGHGNDMVNAIVSQNKNAEILSIRALDDNGNGTISSLIAAMEYAMEQKVDVINLSLYARATLSTSVLKSEIEKATTAGIVVVGAAGNDGMDVTDYVPGNVESAYVIGASNSSGFRRIQSNYGKTVDYYVSADSTSEATALFTGFVTANGLDRVNEVLNQGLIFKTDYRTDVMNFTKTDFENGKTVRVNANGNVKVTVTDTETGKYQIYSITKDKNEITIPEKDSIHIDVCTEDDMYTMERVRALDSNGNELKKAERDINKDCNPSRQHVHRNTFFDVSGKELSSLDVIITQTKEAVPVFDELANDCYFESMLCGPDCLQEHIRLNNEPIPVNDEDFKIAGKFDLDNPNSIQVNDTKNGTCKVTNHAAPHSSARFSVAFHADDIFEKAKDYEVGRFKCMDHKSASWGNGGADTGYYVAKVTKKIQSGETLKVKLTFTIYNNSDHKGPSTNGNYQRISGSLWFRIAGPTPKNGGLIISKYSSNNNIDESLICYSLAGAEYRLYKNYDGAGGWNSSDPSKNTGSCSGLVHTCGKTEHSHASSCYSNGSLVCGKTAHTHTDACRVILTTDEDGFAERSNIPAGTYFLKETKAPSNGNYALNPTVKKVTIKSDEDTDIDLWGYWEEYPIHRDPLRILLKKRINMSGLLQPGEAMGNIKLGGIQFRISYFNSLNYMSAPTESDPNRVATAVFQTDADGSLLFNTSNPISGEWPFKDDDERYNILPIGTYVISEEQSVPGVTKAGTRYWFTVEKDSSGVARTYPKSANWTNIDPNTELGPFDNTDVWMGGVTVYKLDDDYNHTSTLPQGDANMAGVTYKIYNKSDASVVVNGRKYGTAKWSGNTEASCVMTISTVETTLNGQIAYQATTGANKLPYGTYEIVEISSNEHYNMTNWSQTFSITQNGQMVTYGLNNGNPNVIKRGGLAVMKVDADTERSEPQGDAKLENTSYRVANVSRFPVYVNGQWYPVGADITTISSKLCKKGSTSYNPNENAGKDVYLAATGNGTEGLLPIGTYRITEITPPVGYLMPNQGFTTDVSIRANNLHPLATHHNANPVQRGGVVVGKVDKDWDTSNPQGDARLDGAEFTIYNRSAKSVVVYNGSTKKEVAKNGEVCVIQTSWNDILHQYTAQTPTKYLPYGTYEIVETKAPTGYLLPPGGWKKTFKIRAEGQVVQYIDHPEHDEEPVQRGGIIVGKVTRELGQYVELGESSLEKSTFEIINRSEHPVFVNGTTYPTAKNTDDKDAVSKAICFVMSTQKMEWKGKTIYAAFTGDRKLPYGTYEIREAATGKGMLYDTPSKTWRKVVQIRSDGQIIDLTNEGDHNNRVSKDHPDNLAYIGDTIGNQPIREDFHFQKKDQNTQDIMANVPFLLTSLTTGEKHIIVTDENGTWGSASTHYEESDATQSAYRDHTQKTNANDPTSPISNGAVKIDKDGKWYVADTSKLDSEAGTWFAGVSDDMITWKKDTNGQVYYTINDGNYYPDDDKRAFPYDRYLMEELPCESNKDHNMLKLHVTLHKYTKDHDGLGINLDYGTLFDNSVALDTFLSFDDTDKTIPNAPDVDLKDMVTFSGISSGKYTMKSELWLVSEDGKKAERKITETSKDFKISGSFGIRNVAFNLDTTKLGGRTLVAYEYIYDSNGQLIASHEDPTDTEQQVKVIDIHTTLTGDLDHMDYGTTDVVELVDTITYDGLDTGKTYTVTGELMDKETNKPVLDGDGKKITTETEFTAPKTSGTINVTFKFSGVNLAGHTVVAFETISRKNVEYAVHADINDEGQTVHYPDIDTLAANAENGTKELAEAKEQKIVDTIQVANLLDGYEYKLMGELHVRGKKTMDKAEETTDEESAKTVELTDEGVVGTAEITWNDNKSNQTMTFTGVDASELGGKDIVVFQNLYGRKISKEDTKSDWVLIGTHADLSDEDQVVHVPHIGTTALTDVGLHEYQITEDGKMVTITDRVAYENLTPGLEYTLDGRLHLRGVDKDGNVVDMGPAVDTNGTEIAGVLKTTEPDKSEDADKVESDDKADDIDTEKKANLTFVPTEADGYVDMVFTFDASVLNQLNATDDGKAATGSAITGSAITGSAVSVDGTKDKAEIKNLTTVAFEYLSLKGGIIATHEDIEDEGQSVHFVEIGTSARTEEGLQESQVTPDGNNEVVITDTIAYKNLVPGVTYTAAGTIHIQDKDKDGNIVDGGALKDKDGNDVTSELTFTPKTTDGTVDMKFKFDASELNNKTIVIFESLARDGVTFAVHADITDEGQSIHFVDIRTTALTKDGLHETQVPTGDDRTVTITDTVFYKNLVPGRKYTANGTLHLQDKVVKDGKMMIVDGGVLKNADGKLVTGTKTFVPKKANGSVDIKFTFDASALEGKTVVAFEDLNRDGIKIATHSDITDEEQSVHFVKIRTSAVTQDKTHTVKVPKEGDLRVTITDTVTYENLIPGLEYVMKGIPHIQNVDESGKITDGGELKDAAGNVVTAQTTFKPESANGTIDVVFNLSTADFADGTLVMFETLTYDDKLVGEHSDITDGWQSIKFLPPDKDKQETPDKPEKQSKTKKSVKKTKSPISKIWETIKTGQNMFLLVALIGLLLMSGAGYLFFTKTETGRRLLEKFRRLFSKE